MDIIKVFRSYMKQYHTHLAGEDWIADVRKISVKDLTDENLKKILPQETGEQINCWCFYYESTYRNVVFLIQDSRGENNIVITLLQNGIPVYPVNFKSAVF